MAYAFSEKLEKKFQWLLTRYPQSDAVLLPLLHDVQDEAGYLTPDAIDFVAGKLNLSSARVREVASFYSMFKMNKKGKFVLQVCHNLSCYLAGADDVVKALEDKLGIKAGQMTEDEVFSIERVECLASCSTAPVMQVNVWDYHESLTPESALKIIDDLKSGKLAMPSYEDRIAAGGDA